MDDITINLATQIDKFELIKFFQHYKNQDLIENRVSCYLSHNFTVVAKDQQKIVGVLQWYLKENPKAGVVEFEEIFVLEKYRRQGIGTKILIQAISSVQDHFKKLAIRPRKIYLFVSQNNTPARALYEKVGFVNISPVGTLFNDLETELFYCLNLS